MQSPDINWVQMGTWYKWVLGTLKRWYHKRMGRDFLGGPVPEGLTAKVVISFQWLICIWLFAALWTTAHQAPLSFTASQSLLKLMPPESLILSNHLILCHPFSSCFQSFPALGSFSMNQVFTTAEGLGSISGWGTKISQVLQHGPKKKKKKQ